MPPSRSHDSSSLDVLAHGKVVVRADASLVDNTGAAYQRDFADSRGYESVATLADDPAGLTCSVDVGSKWAADGNSKSLFGYPTYEAGASLVRAGRHEALLVAGAYPEIRRFFFDPQLRAVQSFVAALPDFVLAVPQSPRRAAEVPWSLNNWELAKIYYHPATVRLLAGLDTEGHVATEEVTSNSLACRRAMADSATAAAITNSLCAQHYGFEVLRLLSRGTTMSFVVFESSSA